MAVRSGLCGVCAADNFQATTALLEKARSVVDPIRRKSICLSGLQLLYGSYEDFAILLHAFKNRKDGRHLHLTIGVEDQTRTGSTGVPRIFKHYESARQMLDNFGFTSITYERMAAYLDNSKEQFEDHYKDIATSVRGLGEYQDSINIHKNKLKHGKPVLEGLVDRKDMAENVLFLRWNDNNGKWELELRWVRASLEQLEVAIKQVTKLYIRSLELLWLFMLHYYPQHADKFRDEALVKCSNKCIEQVLGLGLESEGLTYPYLFYPPNLTAHSTRRLDSVLLKIIPPM